MNSKVILILVDGMRADAVNACQNAYAQKLIGESTLAPDARTVMPSVTLPCHMSLFHSVTPERHGVTTNLYTPQVRPVEGLIERLARVDKKCAFFYTWEELRDLSRPGPLHTSVLINLHHTDNTDDRITDAAIKYINDESPDFLFLYLGDTDEDGGHDTGWMSETYLKVVSNAFDCIKRVRESIPAEYNVIVTADHGGHDRNHGSDCPEDMTIPIIMNGPAFEKGKTVSGAGIMDIAPTIARIMGATPAKEWEGRSLV